MRARSCNDVTIVVRDDEFYGITRCACQSHIGGEAINSIERFWGCRMHALHCGLSPLVRLLWLHHAKGAGRQCNRPGPGRGMSLLAGPHMLATVTGVALDGRVVQRDFTEADHASTSHTDCA